MAKEEGREERKKERKNVDVKDFRFSHLIKLHFFHEYKRNLWLKCVIKGIGFLIGISSLKVGCN